MGQGPPEADSARAPAMVIFDTDTLVANNGNANHFIVKYNSSGMPIWAKSYGGLQYGQVFEIKTDTLNNLYLLNYSSDSSSYSIRKYDSNGNSVWTKYMHGMTLNSISVDQQSNISFCGHSSNIMLAGKLDNNGNTLWITSNNYSTNYNEATDIVAAENGNSFVCGSYSSNVKFGQNLFVSHTVFQNNFTVLINDSTYVPEHKNKITGNIYVDANSNCNFDLGENNLSGASVIAQPGNYCAVTDNFGNYTLNVDSANYTISQILSTSSSLNTYQLCPNANSVYTVNAQSNNQTYANYNFADSTLACSFLKINYNFNHNYIVCDALVNRTFVIENMGSVASNNTEVSITISKSFKPISSTPAWTSYNPIDSTVLFNIGTLLPNSTYSITILDSVICNNIVWQLPYSYTHIVRVTPINECISTDSIFNNYTLVDYFFISVATPIYTIIKSINIYPNPTKDKIILESTEQLGEIIITNVLGATVFLSTTNNKSLDIDLSNLSPGIYYINALGQHRTIIKE